MADDKPKATPVKLFITTCSSVYTGTNSRGDAYTIYEVEANTENGKPVEGKKLRSFEDLPLGELLDLTVTRFESEKHGVSFTLARKGGKVSSHQRINDLNDDVQALLRRLEIVERWIGQQGATQAGAQRKADLDERFGAEPPY